MIFESQAISRKKYENYPKQKTFSKLPPLRHNDKKNTSLQKQTNKNIIKKISKLNLKIMKIRKLREKKGVREKIY